MTHRVCGEPPRDQFPWAVLLTRRRSGITALRGLGIMAIVVLVMVDGCFWSAPSSQP